MYKETVILVDAFDNEIGVMEKMEAHQKGLLHRAFSVFIFNSKNELLLQRRALSKYHSAGLWTNTCCSHPRPGEETLAAAKRRLMEEMGIEASLNLKTHFTYKTIFENDLIEHEFDYVFFGNAESNPIINLEEVDAYKWESVEKIRANMRKNPEEFTTWFKIAMEKIF